MLVQPKATGIAMLNQLKTTLHPFAGAKVVLYKTPVVLTEDTVLADLTLADFTGYAISAAITWSSAFHDPDGNPVIVGQLLTFAGSGGFAVANTIYGYAVVNAAADTLLWAENFPVPINVAAQGDGVVVVPAFGIQSQASSG